MDLNRLQKITKRQFDITMKKEGQNVTDYYTSANYRVFFRKDKRGTNMYGKLRIFYYKDSPIKIGTIFNFKGNTYIVMNRDSVESDIYFASVCYRCNETIKGNVPIALDTTVYTTSGEGTIQELSGYINVFTGLNENSKKIEINDQIECYGGYYKVYNFMYRDNLAYFRLERTAAPAYVYTLTYKGKTEIDLEKEQTLQLIYEAKRNQQVISSPSLTYQTSDEQTASVNGTGLVTFKKAGTVKITTTWTYDEDHITTCQTDFTITEPTYSLTFSGTQNLTLPENKSYQLNYKALKNSVEQHPALTYESDDDTTAEVNVSGLMTVKKAGTPTITATWVDGRYTTKCQTKFTITGEIPPVLSLTFTGKTNLTLPDDATYQLSYNATKDGVKVEHPTLTYQTSDEETAEVNESGLMTVKKAGSPTITAKWVEGKYSTQTETKFTIGGEFPPTYSLEYKGETTLDIGQSTSYKLQYEAKKNDEIVSSPNLSYSTDSTEFATVGADGTLTLKKAGTVRVTATWQDGSYTTKCETDLTITGKIKPVYSLTYTGNTTLDIGESTTYKLSYRATKDGQIVSEPNLTYSTDGEDVATVSPDGTLTLVKAGSVTVTARWQDEEYTTECVTSITVTGALKPTIRGYASVSGLTNIRIGYPRTLTVTFNLTDGGTDDTAVPKWTINYQNGITDQYLTIQEQTGMTLKMMLDKSTPYTLANKAFSVTVVDTKGEFTPATYEMTTKA